MISGKLLDKRLTVFFWNALRVAVRNPRQAVSFARTLLWLRRSARARTGWKRKGVPVPPIIIFSITNRCNLACRGCYANAFHPSVEDELGRERMLEIIREAEALGVSFFVIAGGEPFLR
jgi:sulfatase maturation enzyme AslB (radical SAM superfamily)